MSTSFSPVDAAHKGRIVVVVGTTAGEAVDIKAINGVDIGQGRTANPAAAELVRTVQGIAMGMAQVRESSGPLGLWKTAAPGEQATLRGGVFGSVTYFADVGASSLWPTHQNHVHIGFSWGQ